jgi:hypothetical protein
MNAMSTLIRHFAVYLLVLLLPLQAAASSRFVVCAEMSTAPHCDHSATMTTPSADHDMSSKSTHGGSTCWLGSICMASVGFAALPATHNFLPIDQTDSISPFTHHPYDSFIPEGPQRPPAILRA